MPLIGLVLSGGWDDAVPHLLTFVAIAIGWLVVIKDPRTPVRPALAWASTTVALSASPMRSWLDRRRSAAAVGRGGGSSR